MRKIRNSNKLIVGVLILAIISILVACVFLITNGNIKTPIEEHINNPEFVKDFTSQPVRPDILVIVTDEGFLENQGEFKSPNEPVDATILILNTSSSSATISIRQPNNIMSNPITLPAYEDYAYIAKTYGNYVIQNSTAGNSMQVILQKE